MSIWHKEVVRVDGELKAYVGVQNDYTGSIRYDLRNIHLSGDTYYCIADGRHVDLNAERRKLLEYEDKCQRAIKWYDSTKF